MCIRFAKGLPDRDLHRHDEPRPSAVENPHKATTVHRGCRVRREHSSSRKNLVGDGEVEKIVYRAAYDFRVAPGVVGGGKLSRG